MAVKSLERKGKNYVKTGYYIFRTMGGHAL
jgi:hypothetical protein